MGKKNSKTKYKQKQMSISVYQINNITTLNGGEKELFK